MSTISRRSIVTATAAGVVGLGTAASSARSATTVSGTGLPPEVGEGGFHVFALMGQSNMAGYGLIEPEDREAREGIVYVPTVGGVDWKPAAHPLHNRLASDRFGLGLVFAEEYRRLHPTVTVGLLPLAWGGASINLINKGTQTYTDFLTRLKLIPEGGEFKGVLWHQGESDALIGRYTPLYRERLDQLVADIRADVQDPQLPFIVGDLSERWDYHWIADQMATIRADLKGLPQRVPGTAWVSSAGCSSFQYDTIHFDRAGLIELGQRYAKAYQGLVT